MLIKANEMPRIDRPNWRGGKGVPCILKADPSTYPNKWKLIGVMEFPAGTSIGKHEHVGEYELYFVLSGKGLVTDGDEQIMVLAGDALLTGNGACHCIECVGDELLRVLAVIVEE